MVTQSIPAGRSETDRPTVRFLLRSVDAPGGVARSVLTLAGSLTQWYDVEVVSLFRRRNVPVFPVPAGVRLTYLADHRGPPDESTLQGGGVRPRMRRALQARPSKLIDPADTALYPKCTLLTDAKLLQCLRSMRSGVLITTRPSFHLAAARLAPRGLVLVAQEHMNFYTRPSQFKQQLARRGRHLDALVVLTQRDGRDWRRVLRETGVQVRRIPNPLPWPVGDDGQTRSRVVVAAGRLAPQKGFDRLIQAFGPVAATFPDWRLQIYGVGDQRGELEQLIEQHNLQDSVQLMGWTDRMRDALAEASVFALSSRFEGLPLVVIEALGKGVPVVAFDCPRGPRELVRDGRNGFLVPDGDIAGFSAALARVIGDAGLRDRLRRGALADARQYDLAAVGERWKDLLETLLVDPPRGGEPAQEAAELSVARRPSS